LSDSASEAETTLPARPTVRGGPSRDHAGAVVVLDTTLRFTAGNRSSVAYLHLSLVRQRGTWKVDAAKPISAAA